MHHGIKLRHIRAFLDITATGNLTAVARAQGITQPALSRSLAELEALLGAALFLRQGRRLILTEAGAVFRRHAQAGLQSLSEGARALAPGDSTGRLGIGVLPTVATRLFPKVALRFGTLRPDVTLSVETGPNTYLLRLLREARIDLMVGRMPGAHEMAGLSFRHLYEEEVVLCLRAGHPMADRPLPEVLTRCPLILPPASAIIRRTVNDYIASLGLTELHTAFETVSLSIGRALVEGSDAVWFISQGVILDELAQGRLITLPAQARFLSGAVGVTQRQGGGSEPGLEVLLQQLIRAADEAVG